MVRTQPDPNSDLLNIKEAAALLKVSEASLRRWTNAGRLACLRLGAKRERRFRREDLMSFLEDRDAAAAPAAPTDSRSTEVLLEGIAIEYGNHICTLYENDLGRLKWSVPFLADGLRNGDGCFLIATKAVRDEILGHIGEVWDGVAQPWTSGPARSERRHTRRRGHVPLRGAQPGHGDRFGPAVLQAARRHVLVSPSGHDLRRARMHTRSATTTTSRAGSRWSASANMTCAISPARPS